MNAKKRRLDSDTTWSDVFQEDPKHYTLPYGHDSEITKILIVSNEETKDQERVAEISRIWKKIQWKVIDKNTIPPDRMIEVIETDFHATHVILNFKHENQIVWKKNKINGKWQFFFG